MNLLNLGGFSLPSFNMQDASDRASFQTFANLYGAITPPFYDIRRVERVILQSANHTKDSAWRATLGDAVGFDIPSVPNMVRLHDDLTGTALHPAFVEQATQAEEIVGLLGPLGFIITACDVPHGDRFFNPMLFVSENNLRRDFYARAA